MNCTRNPSIEEPPRPTNERSVARPAPRRVPDARPLDVRATDIAGRFFSGCPDLAEEHDRYLCEAFDS